MTWREPTLDLPLRWGTYRARYISAVVLLICGGLLFQITSAYTFYVGVFGAALMAAGWTVVPAAGWRRGWAGVPGVLGAAALLGGADSSPLAALTLASWLLVRHRPARSAVVLVFPVFSGTVLGQLFPQYGSGAIVATITLAVLIGCAWLARRIATMPSPARAVRRGIRSGPRTDQPKANASESSATPESGPTRLT